MRHRLFAWMGVLAVMVTFVWLSGGTIGQTQTAVAMTPWGEPDLQGIWTDPYATNLQRPPDLGSESSIPKVRRTNVCKLKRAES